MTHAKAISISYISGFDQGDDGLYAQKHAAIAGDVSVNHELTSDCWFRNKGYSPNVKNENQEKSGMGPQ